MKIIKQHKKSEKKNKCLQIAHIKNIKICTSIFFVFYQHFYRNFKLKNKR